MWVGGDAGQYIPQVGEGIDVMALAGGSEAEENRGGLAPVVGVAEQPVLPLMQSST
jgi:hypothetical protein